MRFAAALLLLSASTLSVAAADAPADSRIDTVTVFPSGAEVTRVAKLKLEKGEHTVVLSDLPAEVLSDSVRVEGKATGKLDIGSVDTRRLMVPHSDAKNAEAERRRLEDELDALHDQKTLLDAQVQTAETQKTLVTNLTQLPTRPAPSGTGAIPENWGQILALIGSAGVDAQRMALDATVKLRALERQIGDLEGKLASLAPAEEERTEVRVFVEAADGLEADFALRYQVTNASWMPLYDARLATGNKADAPRLEITRRAEITQTTGEAWQDAAVTLSTTRPSAGADAPQLSSMLVNFEIERPRPAAMAAPSELGRAAEMDATAPAPQVASEEFAGDAPRKVTKPAIAERNTEVVIAPFQALFAVPGRLTIPNTGEAKKVQLQADELEATLGVKTTPKADARAFLYAKLVTPKGSPMLPGLVSLFRDGTFVGTGKLPLLSPGEEHELGFGVDDLVRVKHAVVEEKRGETGLISTSRTDSRNYKLTVKNMHERAISVTVFDQLPVSQNQEIKVELTGRTAPTIQDVDDRRGVVAWESSLDPDDEWLIDFGYRVSWPSAKAIEYH